MFIVMIFLLAFGVGFSARRGGICLVGATAEIIERRSAQNLLFVIEAMTVALALTAPAILLFPDYVQFSQSHNLTILFFGGALLYGVGAGLNGGCALGTINKLLSGQINFVGTVLGIAAGFYIFLLFLKQKAEGDTILIMSNEVTRYVLIALLIIAWVVICLRVRQLFLRKGNPQLKLCNHL